MNAADWKAFYARERESLGECGLLALFDRAPRVEFGVDTTLIFPHTRLKQSGHLVASAARAVVESGNPIVLALGVLHRRDRDDPNDRAIYGDEVEASEFSLDNFRALTELYAKHAHQPAPRIIRAYPFLTGTSARTMRGFADLRKSLAGGAPLVATTDPVHHGAGYDTPRDQWLSPDEPATPDIARAWITEALEALHRRDYPAFYDNARRVRSDFRDVGPLLSELLDFPRMESEIIDLELVEYADVLRVAEPTWVAAALIRVAHASSNS